MITSGHKVSPSTKKPSWQLYPTRPVQALLFSNLRQHSYSLSLSFIPSMSHSLIPSVILPLCLSPSFILFFYLSFTCFLALCPLLSLSYLFNYASFFIFSPSFCLPGACRSYPYLLCPGMDQLIEFLIKFYFEPVPLRLCIPLHFCRRP